jgi:hypothetical protein
MMTKITIVMVAIVAVVIFLPLIIIFLLVFRLDRDGPNVGLGPFPIVKEDLVVTSGKAFYLHPEKLAVQNDLAPGIGEGGSLGRCELGAPGLFYFSFVSFVSFVSFISFISNSFVSLIFIVGYDSAGREETDSEEWAAGHEYKTKQAAERERHI